VSLFERLAHQVEIRLRFSRLKLPHHRGALGAGNIARIRLNTGGQKQRIEQAYQNRQQ
jgi:hypothetical protein